MNKDFISVDINKILNKFKKLKIEKVKLRDYLITIYGSYQPPELYNRLSKVQRQLLQKGFPTGLVCDYSKKSSNESNLLKSLRYIDISTINIFIFLLTEDEKLGSSGILLEYPSIITKPKINEKSFAIFEDHFDRFFPNTTLVGDHFLNAPEKPLYDTFILHNDSQLFDIVNKYIDELVYRIEKKKHLIE